MNLKEQLYQPYDPRLKHHTIFQKNFYLGAIHISLRPFLIPEDLELYNEWISTELNKEEKVVDNKPIITEDYFEAIAWSSHTLCVCGLINDQPCFVMEAHPALIHCPADTMPVIKPVAEDVLLQLVIDPHTLTDTRINAYILQACLTYLAGFAELKQAFWIIDAQHPWYNRLAEQTGVLIHSTAGKQVHKYELALYG